MGYLLPITVVVNLLCSCNCSCEVHAGLFALLTTG